MWRSWPRANWIVTNPPFNLAPKIVPLAYEAAVDGSAMLLRLSYLEPCESDRAPESRRGKWLQAHPPTDLIVLPRISFTGDGKKDNVTCAWLVWNKHKTTQTISFVLNEPDAAEVTTAPLVRAAADSAPSLFL